MRNIITYKKIDLLMNDGRIPILNQPFKRSQLRAAIKLGTVKKQSRKVYVYYGTSQS